ncbi:MULTISPECIES: glycosyltransferase [unclassified Solwaraspora]|uniref:glycosyltransferase n=1 Tax=unclassified Solwaraspora TaxID=2627926 RepID=UPI00259BA1C3|nr:glycosyltransferase family 2 protein [Solwaraspora sp. WMMA2056]WJK41698.1 glycosyltransferase family 2 protein [Solwaraspora sp. WMMA2056]
MTRGAGSDTSGPAGVEVTWRLRGLAPPRPAERLGRAVGLRVLRVPGTGQALVVAGTVDRLRDLTHHPAAGSPVRSVTVVVAWWRSPRVGWGGTVGMLPRLRRHRVGLPRLRRGAATVRLAVAAPVALRDAVRSALNALDGARPMPAPGSPDVTGVVPARSGGRAGGRSGGGPAFLSATATVTTGELTARDEIRAHDLVVTPAAVAPRPDDAGTVLAGTVLAGSGHRVTVTEGAPMVLVDATRINPRGRPVTAYRSSAPEATLEFARGGRSAARFRADPATGPAGGRTLQGALTGPGLDATALAALRQVRAVHCRLVPGEHPAQTAGLLVQIAATGVLLHAPVLPPAVADLLDPDLRALVSTPPPTPDHDDPAGTALAVEARSVRQRRAALRGHAAGLRLPALATGGLPVLGQPPSVSAILVTRRAELVPVALAAIAAQTYPELEIVLGLHGIDLPEPARRMLSDCGRPFEVVRLPASADFGAALGAVTRRARGTLVTKFDDDDSYGVEHVWDLVLARHYSGAVLVGKGAELVHLEREGVTLRRSSGVPEAYGDVVAGGTMLLAKGDLEAVGGWRPVPRSVDLGLIERLRAAGASVYRTHPLGYLYHRRPTGHTWDPGEAYFVDSAYARWPGVPPDAMADPVRSPSTAAASDAAGAAATPTGPPPS